MMKDDEGNTPFVIACVNNRKDIVKMLIDNGADIETNIIVGFYHQNILTVVSYLGYPGIVEILLENGADIKVHDKNNETCLDFECKGIWEEEYTQELIICLQPQNIKFLDDNIGILPSMKKKYDKMIGMSEMGFFG